MINQMAFHRRNSHFGGADAECDCPAYGAYYDYCKHIAAVMLQIYHMAPGSAPRVVEKAAVPGIEVTAGNAAAVRRAAKSGAAVVSAPPARSAISREDMLLADRVLEVFGANAPAAASPVGANRELVHLEVYVATTTFARRTALAIELKLGPARTYVVQKIRDFLSNLERGSKQAFTKTFTFNPSVHDFSDNDRAILHRLMEISRNESMYREGYGWYSSGMKDRSLYIPPGAWEELVPMLAEKDAVWFGIGSGTGVRNGPLRITDDPLPIRFSLSHPSSDAYQLELKDVHDIVLLEAYGYALADGVLHRMKADRMKRLADLKDALVVSWQYRSTVRIAPSRMDDYMERVIPALKQVGELTISPEISDRIVHVPLSARLYLDRSGEGLSIRTEFVYGDRTIHPFHPQKGVAGVEERILMRDAEGESRILALIGHLPVRDDGSHMLLEREDEVYGFLRHVLPLLKKQAEIYATPAVKAMLNDASSRPSVSVDVNERTNWLDVRFDMEGIDEQEIRQILRTVVEKKKYYRLKDGSFLSLEGEEFGEVSKLMDELGIRKTDIKGAHLALPVVRGLSLMETDVGKGNVKLGKALRRLLNNLKNPDNLDYSPPETLAPVLRDYQKTGFQWMKTLGHYGFGGILADDMGLGKTLQSIAYILSEQERVRSSGCPVLIVCPASLVYNWRNELARFAPELAVEVAAGAKQERSGILDELSGVEVLITSYPLLRRDTELYEKRRFHGLILDEAQAIKNHATQTAQVVKRLQAGQRFALTGTPVENSLDELWSIYDAVFPELFDGKKAFDSLPRDQVARKTRPFLLRRLKGDVLKELPEKIETLQPSELNAEQKKLYAAYLSRLQKETAQQLEAEGFQKSRMRILAGLTRLRQLCCHPALFVENYSGGSGKLEQLMELVEECVSGGKRMLIFSQFTEMLGMIRRELDSRGTPHFYLDGSTPSAERVELCHRFNEGEGDAFLISLRAGGTGLNLTGADTVILYDLWWNPAVEQQAADRAHRMGQKKVVQVIRLITQGTIEEKMYELQQRKRDLIDSVIQPGDDAIASITEAEIRELLAIV